MKRFTISFIAVFFCLSISNLAQVVDFNGVSMDRLIEIVKAEDELRYDKTLEDFMKSPNPILRKRAALAAGRIGNEDAIPILTNLLMKDTEDVRQMAAFALGEIESIKGADAVLSVLKERNNANIIRASAIEAAGKIAAANAKHEKSKELAIAILESLEFEAGRRSRQSENVILMGFTAVLRAKPEKAEVTLAKFLGYSNWRIKADALNTLARLMAKNSNDKAKELLQKDENPIVRANAARVLSAAEDKTSLELLINHATTDQDSRVRINAIRSLGSLKDAKSADILLNRAEKLFAEYKKSKYKNPIEQNELLDIATVLGNILKGTDNERAVKFLNEFFHADNIRSPEIGIAIARISPKIFVEMETQLPKNIDWKGDSSFLQGLSEIADLSDSENNKILKEDTKNVVKGYKNYFDKIENVEKAYPDLLKAYAKFKIDNLEAVLRNSLKSEDIIIRATVANLLGEIKTETPEQWMAIYKELSNALYEARTDKSNDASLAILDALKKQYENRPPLKVKFPFMSPFISAMGSPDYLIRRKAAEIYKGFDIPKPDPMTVGNPDFKPFEIPKDIGIVKFDGDRKDGAKSRVIRADYKKALSRKNGEWGVILKTKKGEFRIDFFPEEAPLTVDNFIKLAQSGYFNGLEIHRVVPNFVMQDGDSRGDGNGGPGWQIRCEINQIQYERGMVGMALSGKDTGGSQWFVTHSPQPHLDGGYTIFGKVNETGMKIVDNLVRGDKIISVNIIRAAPGK